MGNHVKAAGGNAITIGSGVFGGSRLVNNMDNSLMVGFNSDIPTFLVSGAPGPGTTGRIAIGSAIVAPHYKVFIRNDFDQIGLWSKTATTDQANAGSLSEALLAVKKSIGAVGNGFTTGLQAVGIRGWGTGSSETAIGGEFEASFAGIANIGVCAYAPDGNMPDNSPDCAAFFDGDICGTGDDLYNLSDVKFKQDIQPLTQATELLSKIEPKTYRYRKEDYPQIALPHGLQYGMIAQEVEEVIPEFVKDKIYPSRIDKEGHVKSEMVEFKALNYGEFIPILIQGFKEQQAEIERLNESLEAMKTLLDQYGVDELPEPVQLEGGSERVVLQQNHPNPFREKTTISYFIPGSIHRANIIFFDQSGKMILEKPVDPGQGSIEVFAHDLSSGLYTYSIVADGKVVETRKMNVSK